ncbi:MAG: hypothetical protein LM562_01305 [Pyrobaculum sp.]|nr:hypothetical protein [Pyrobaculum sp.]
MTSPPLRSFWLFRKYRPASLAAPTPDATTFNPLPPFTFASTSYAAKATFQSRATACLPLAKPTSPIAADTYPSPSIAPEVTAPRYLSVVSSTPSFSA